MLLLASGGIADGDMVDWEALPLVTDAEMMPDI